MRPLGFLDDGTPFHAPVGRLVVDGDRVCCHLCGRLFLSVASHLRVHGWTKADYIAAFGLEYSNPLSGEATRKRRAAALTARFALEPAVQRAMVAAQARARSGALTAAAAAAARGRPHPPERRVKTLATLAGIGRDARGDGSRLAANRRVNRVAAQVAARFGFATFADYLTDRLARGLSMAAVSREAGLHQDWVSRQIAAVAPGVTRPHHTDLRLGPAAARFGFADVGAYLRARHVEQHRSVAAIAGECAVSRATIQDALSHHGIRPVPHATSRHRATIRATGVARGLGYESLDAYIAARRAGGHTWRSLSVETGLPETTLIRHARRILAT